MDKTQIFISYRREGGAALAGRISDHLKAKGYVVFFDMETIHSGKFNEQIIDAIQNCEDFLLVLPPKALDRCIDENDWIRKEIELALKHHKNIIPILMQGFDFPDVLPVQIDDIRNMEGVTVTNEYFSAMIERIEGFLSCNQKKAQQDAFAKGNIVGGRYEIICEIGCGAFARVYQANDITTNMLVAIKRICRKDCLDFNAVKEQAKQEFDIQKKCVHSGISVIRGCWETKNEFSIVMDYIDGQTLAALIDESRISEENVLKWGVQICSALHYLHTKEEPVFLGDIKPSNVMITNSGEAILIDFGAAQPKEFVCTGETTVLGTRGYAAPEQFMNIRNACTDIFNLGMTLHHALTGISPFQHLGIAMPIRDVDANLSKGLEKIIAKCTNLYPEKRYQTAEELKKDLESVIAKQHKRIGFFKLFKK